MRDTLFKLTKCPTMEQFQILRNRVDQAENLLDRFKKQIGEFERKIKMMGGNKNPNSQASPQEELLNWCVDEITDMREKMPAPSKHTLDGLFELL